MADNTKECPYCAETIKESAKVCRHCGLDLATGRAPGAEPQKKKRRSLLRTLGILILACIVLGGAASLFLGDKDGDSTADNTADSADASANEPAPTSTPVPLAPPVQEILSDVEGMTDAQRNAYNRDLAGKRVENWQGTIKEVDEGEILGGFSVLVDMDPERLGYEVSIDVTEEVALELNMNQEITFSGTIDFVSDLMGATVYVVDATIK